MAETEKYKALKDILINKKTLSPQQWDALIIEHKESGKSISKLLVESGSIPEEALLKIIASLLRTEVIELEKVTIEQTAINKMPATLAQVYNILPVRINENILSVAVGGFFSLDFFDNLRFTLECNIQPIVARESDIQAKIKQYYKLEKEPIDELYGKFSDSKKENLPGVTGRQIELKPEQLQKLAAQAPIVKLLNLIILEAVKDKASDIHFEPFGDNFKIRYRIDGQCVEAASPPKDLNLALASRIKVMANLDVAETRLPQDGRILADIAGKKVDLRVSTLPTLFGESIVLRVLDKSVVSLSLDQIGLEQTEKEKLKSLIIKPNGIILVTGPTGSGKTTTLYSCLQNINNIEVKIITAEDPVEYDIKGIIQVNIKPKIDLTFARCLRHILRQDPDIIMIGEIRDKETAEIAIQSALTGHLVFSTLHTNDAAGAITRLLDMDIAPFLIASTISASLAQRLIRTICPDCKEAYSPQEKEAGRLGLNFDEIKGRNFYRGKGCSGCKNTGYKGRTGLFECFVIDDTMRSLILEKKPAQVLKETAVQAGMRLLREDGLNKIYQGITTVEEVVNQTQSFV
ncbi:MAG: ATPase, T2SS/T4P/T4SS family [Candidatus Omnitrophota bacterium]